MSGETEQSLEAWAFALREWTGFLDANPDDLTSPEEWPDHALITFDQAWQFLIEPCLSAALQSSAEVERERDEWKAACLEVHAVAVEHDVEAFSAPGAAARLASKFRHEEARALAAEAQLRRCREECDKVADLLIAVLAADPGEDYAEAAKEARIWWQSYDKRQALADLDLPAGTGDVQHHKYTEGYRAGMLRAAEIAERQNQIGFDQVLMTRTIVDAIRACASTAQPREGGK